MTLSSEERELFVEIGYHIARVMWQNLGGSDPTYQAVMHDRAESVYEHGCGIMSELGVFRSESSGTYRFAMPLADVREHLKDASTDSTRSLDRIIGNFLWATGPYQGDVSDEKEPFDVPGSLQQAMWALVKLGYATREPQGFMWTDKIAPIMITEHLWSLDGESHTTLARQKKEDLAERIWAAIPLWRRHLLARWIVGKSGAELFTYLFQRWDGDSLRLFKLPQEGFRFMPSEFTGASYEVGRRLLAIRKRHPF